jgi:hypothetical protein
MSGIPYENPISADETHAKLVISNIRIDTPSRFKDGGNQGSRFASFLPKPLLFSAPE